MLAFWTPSGWELLIILVIGLLLFGRKLPEVGRSLGKAIVEFKKGVKGVEDEIEDESSKPRLPADSGRNRAPASTDEPRTVSTADKVEGN